MIQKIKSKKIARSYTQWDIFIKLLLLLQLSDEIKETTFPLNQLLIINVLLKLNNYLILVLDLLPYPSLLQTNYLLFQKQTSKRSFTDKIRNIKKKPLKNTQIFLRNQID